MTFADGPGGKREVCIQRAGIFNVQIRSISHEHPDTVTRLDNAVGP
ncbi:hypothetical protein LP421_02135 (plasmid) [Rhizobium sp. RCAM05350]|nr:hypothetical protein LP421_02135 [Rhizobium sp. RCAM05350]